MASSVAPGIRLQEPFIYSEIFLCLFLSTMWGHATNVTQFSVWSVVSPGMGLQVNYHQQVGWCAAVHVMTLNTTLRQLLVELQHAHE